jgi:hypothetical protein
MKVWYIGRETYFDIDDAVEAVVSLVGDREREIHKFTHADSDIMIFKEARATLQHMCEGDVHDFMGVLITTGNIPLNIDI